MTTATRLNRGQAGGLALIQKYGREHMQTIGRMGGRPRILTLEDIIPEAASTDRGNGRGLRHGKSLKELLKLWRERQAAPNPLVMPDAACLHNGERSSLEDSQHLGVGEPDLSPKNNSLSIILPSNPSSHTTIPTTIHFNTNPSPREGSEG